MNSQTHIEAINPTVFGAMRRFKRVVIATFIIGIVGSWIYVSMTTPKYAAVAGISLGEPPASVAAPSAEAHMTAAQYADQQMAILSSTTVIKSALAIVNSKFPTAPLTFRQMKSALSIKPPQPAATSGGTLVTTVTVTLPDAKIDARIAATAANAVVKSYIVVFHKQIKTAAKHTLNALTVALKTVTSKLSGVVTPNPTPKSKQKTTSGSTTTTTTLQSSSTTSTTLANHSSRQNAVSRTSAISQGPLHVAPRVIESGMINGHVFLHLVSSSQFSQKLLAASSDHIGGLVQQSVTLQATSRSNSKTVGSTSVGIDSSWNTIPKSTTSTLPPVTSTSAPKAVIAAATSTSTTLAPSTTTTVVPASTTTTTTASTAAAKAHRGALTQSLANLTREIASITVNETVDLQYVPVYQIAVAPAAPVVKHEARDIVLGGIIGLLLGIVIAFWLNTKRKRFERSEDPAVLYPGTSIVSVPAFDDLTWSFRSLPILSDPMGEAAESYRTVATALRAQRPATRAMAAVFAGADLGAGATTAAANVAIALSQMGERVVAVDSDALGHTLTRLLVPLTNSLGNLAALPGFSELIEDAATVDEVIVRSTTHQDLSVVPCGRSTNIAVRRWRISEMQKALENLARTYDFIIVDAPPIGLASYGLDLVGGVGNVIMVVPHHDLVELHLSLCERLSLTGANFLGYVYNGSSPSQQFVPYYPIFEPPRSAGGDLGGGVTPIPPSGGDDEDSAAATSAVKILEDYTPERRFLTSSSGTSPSESAPPTLQESLGDRDESPEEFDWESLSGTNVISGRDWLSEPEPSRMRKLTVSTRAVASSGLRVLSRTWRDMRVAGNRMVSKVKS